MSSEWSEYFETITQFLVGASRQYGVAGSIGKNDSKREMDLTRETKQDYDVIRCYK